MNNEQEYSRDEYIYMARIYQIAGKYTEMIRAAINYVKMDPNLNLEERNIFTIGAKNFIVDKRASWRILNHLEKKDEKKNSQNHGFLKDLKTKLEDELRANCEEVQITLDKHLVPNSKDFETKVFYLKLKGDFFRYRAEFTTGKENEQVCLQCEKAYKDAYEIAEKNIPIFSSTRLGLALNLAIFYYEIKLLKEEACHIAKLNYEEAMKIIDELEKNKNYESLQIIQLMNEYLALWTFANELNKPKVSSENLLSTNEQNQTAN